MVPPLRGSASDSAIDLTGPAPVIDRKTPVCIGSLQSRAIMLYPAEAAVIGYLPPEGSKERYELIQYRGAELLRVKLKVGAIHGAI